jgi:hypothetical protein
MIVGSNTGQGRRAIPVRADRFGRWGVVCTGGACDSFVLDESELDVCLRCGILRDEHAAPVPVPGGEGDPDGTA